MIVLIVMAVFAFWSGLRLALNTDYPVLAVASGSMSTVQPDSAWSYPFVRTLHTGDLIIVEGVNPQDIYAAPFNESGRSGDIIVFRASQLSDELIVHRAVAWYDSNHTSLVTQGDGNPVPGPYSPTPVENVIGKVIFRIPWLGNLALLLQNNSGIYLILVLIIILIAAELILSVPESEENRNQGRRGH